MPEILNAHEKPLSSWDYHDFAHRQFAQERQREEAAKRALMLRAAQNIVDKTVKEMEKQNGHQSVS